MLKTGELSPLEQEVYTMQPNMQIRDCGQMEYKKALALQEKLREERLRDTIPNIVLLLEHEPVYTLGKDIIEEKALITGELPVPIVRVNRGGKITYHGPGQLIGYFICKLPVREIGTFIDALEQLTIRLVQEYGISAYSRKEERDSYGKNIRGAWCLVDGVPKKIAAQGLETRSAGVSPEGDHLLVTMHGFALNITTDLRFFKYINPCGFTYDVMTSMREILDKNADVPSVRTMKQHCQEKIKNIFETIL